LKKKVAISIGDPNGVGLQLILENHTKVCEVCDPIYFVNQNILQQAATLLNIHIPNNINLFETIGEFEIKPGEVCKDAGLYSYNSFLDAINYVKENKADAITTLPINKESWSKANIHYVGHTDMLRDVFQEDAIMMLGCEKMYVSLFTEHMPLSKVTSSLSLEKLEKFLLDLKKSLPNVNEKIAVLGLNPHAGDNGVLGNEEEIIIQAILNANKKLGKQIFEGPLVPDIAFTPRVRSQYKYFVAMYHDQGLAPLKALYFDEGINVSLNLPILRTSVDHGTAFDIAYKNINQLSNLSYLNAINYCI
jgi:4-hydroxythreonine-4-phosphate dehydrogenase